MNRSADLHAAARQLLARASILAEAKAHNLQPAPDNTRVQALPPGDTRDTYSQLLRRYQRCNTARDLEQFIHAAEQEIESITKAAEKPKIPFKTRILTEWEGHRDTEVAKVTNTPRSTIRRWRQEAGLNPIDGTRQQAA